MLKKIPSALHALRRHSQAALLLLATAGLALALLHPHWNLSRGSFNNIFVLDISQSMNVQDYRIEGKPVSRLEFAKQSVRHALKNLPCGSKAGLGIFTEYRSYLLLAPVETCANYSELSSLLDNINGQMAWVGGSEIAKGINFGFKIIKKLPDKPGLIFISDGQEAPPVHPDYRPELEVKPGDVRGMLIGAGGLIPAAIPKYDPSGNLIGFWGADDVMQLDRYSDDKSTIVDGKVQLSADQDEKKSKGTEHLSALREAYLQTLARETGIAYHRMETAEGFFSAMKAPSLAAPNRGAVDVAHWFALGSLVAFTFLYAWPLLQKLWLYLRWLWAQMKTGRKREKNITGEIKYRI